MPPIDATAALINSPSVAVDLARALKYGAHGFAPDLDVDDPKVAVGLIRAMAASGATIGVANEHVYAVMDRSLRDTRLVLQAAEATVNTPAPSPTPPGDASPVVGWAAAARILGRSPDTIARRRAAKGDMSEPWWPSAEACRAWFAAMVAPAPKSPRPRRATHTSHKITDAAIPDFNAVIRKKGR